MVEVSVLLSIAAGFVSFIALRQYVLRFRKPSAIELELHHVLHHDVHKVKGRFE